MALVDDLEGLVTVQELIEALAALPPDARSKPVVFKGSHFVGDDSGDEWAIDVVDYDLRVVTLR